MESTDKVRIRLNEYEFIPQEDITPLEVVNCMQVIAIASVQPMTDYADLIMDYGVERHFVWIISGERMDKWNTEKINNKTLIGNMNNKPPIDQTAEEEELAVQEAV